MIKNKKAQEIFGMSYGVIFSIIIILAIISVAFFVVKHFLALNRCTNIGLFYDDLREEVKSAWSSSTGRYQDVFNATLPKGVFGTDIEYVCFGRLSATATSNTISARIQQELIDDYFLDPQSEENVFMYPVDSSCDLILSSIALKCGSANCVNTDFGDTERFFCKKVTDSGKVEVWLIKDSNQYQISLRENAPN
jgi:hypothetical protein